MDKNHRIRTKITFLQKITLILLSLFLSLIILEAGLRFGGFIFLALQEHRNLHSIRQKNSCIIMCLGESTTALGGQDSYPSQLEEVLNARNIGIKFSVVNKGVPAIHTTNIVANLQDNLNRYKPDIVITMMGINDQITYLQDQNTGPASKAVNFLRQLRVYKLGQFILLHIKARIKEHKSYKKEDTQKGIVPLSSLIFELKDCYAAQENDIQKEASLKEPLQLNPRDYGAYIALGRFYINQDKITDAEEVFKKAIEINPQGADGYLGLGACYARQERFSETEELCKKALELNPGNYDSYIALGTCYNSQAKFEQSEKLFKKAIEINPQKEDAYLGLGWSYESQGRNAQAEVVFQKALELNPNNFYSCRVIGMLSNTKGQYARAEILLKKAAELNSGAEEIYIYLGWCYKFQKKYTEAEGAFKKALAINPKDDKAYGGLAEIYEDKGQFESAEEYHRKANAVRVEYYDNIVSVNYAKLKKILDQNKVKLICVQYPNRSAEPLKKIFAGQKGIVFVDNEKVFREAIKTNGYKEYFSDVFGGDFGHCTKKGNRLLAENIANVMLKEIFHR